MTLKCGPQEI
jgi:hypothetical protein